METMENPQTLADELKRLQAENDNLRMQLRRCQRLATVGTMSAMIVHEFNNILTPVINYAQLAANGDPEIVKKAITKAEECGQRATDICEALLGMLRDHASDPQPVRLTDMVNQSLLAIGRSPEKDGIALELNIPEKLSVLARAGELKQVLVNLIINARSAVLNKSRNGRIIISAAPRGDVVALTVADNGCGIAPENLERLFEPFFTTKTGEDDSEVGTGLGLAICMEIMTRMGGAITVASEPGQGASFTLTMPPADA
jgi:signal transduction histidine kinase